LGQNHDDFTPFNQFIDNNTLFDLPLRERLFTWFQGDGASMSRLDRFLLYENWCAKWPNMIQRAFLHGLSNHCPIILTIDKAN